MAPIEPSTIIYKARQWGMTEAQRNAFEYHTAGIGKYDLAIAFLIYDTFRKAP